MATMSPTTTPMTNETTVSEIVMTTASRRAFEVSAWKKMSTSKSTSPLAGIAEARRPRGGRRGLDARRGWLRLLDGLEDRRVHLVLLGDAGQRAVGVERVDGRLERRAEVGLALPVVHAVVVVSRQGVRDLVLTRVLEQEVRDAGVGLPDRIDAAEDDLLELVRDLRVGLDVDLRLAGRFAVGAGL